MADGTIERVCICGENVSLRQAIVNLDIRVILKAGTIQARICQLADSSVENAVNLSQQCVRECAIAVADFAFRGTSHEPSAQRSDLSSRYEMIASLSSVNCEC
jgi:hypothetical protein